MYWLELKAATGWIWLVQQYVKIIQAWYFSGCWMLSVWFNISILCEFQRNTSRLGMSKSFKLSQIRSDIYIYMCVCVCFRNLTSACWEMNQWKARARTTIFHSLSRASSTSKLVLHICVSESGQRWFRMACRLCGAEPLSKPMVVYCRLGHWEQMSVKF